jgi:UDPglucose--hexose-1-phosphate uridylyltransferase
MNKGLYECDLVLRNNITSEDRPLGVFHPNPSLHHIKKENIGLIEVMGLAVLPARLAEELEAVKEAILCGKDMAADPKTASHEKWAKELTGRHPELDSENAMDIIRSEVGAVFEQVLCDAGVFKRDSQGTAAFMKFIDHIR